MDSMRDTGASLFGPVARHWQIRRVKYWLAVNQHVLSETTNPSYEFDYLDIGCVEAGRLTGSFKRLRFGAAPSRARRVVRQGDTLVSMVRPYLRAVWHAESPPPDLVASTGFAVLTAKPSTNPKFVSYLCQSDSFTDRLTSHSVGIAYPAVSEAKLGSIEIAVPPLEEQTAIVRFLDYVTGRIRRAIRAKQLLLELLDEQRLIVIEKAVTGQVDVRTGEPFAADRDSGVEWLPRVPSHWAMRRNKWLFAERNETGHGDLPVLEVSLRSGVGIRDMEDGPRKQQMTDRDKYKRAARGDIAYNTMRLWQGAIGVVPVDGLVSPAYVVARPLRGVEVSYYAYLFRTGAYKQEVDRNSRGIVSDRNRLYWDAFKRLASPHPPPEEQRRIAEYLDTASDRIDAGARGTRHQIALLREYRERLIADAVTGKLDVRDAAARL